VRTLVGVIGYRNLRDHSAAFAVLERLEGEELGSHVLVEDTSYNPIALGQWLESEPLDRRFERIVFVAAVNRAGRRPGDVVSYRWGGTLPPDTDVQQAVAEAVTGIIALDNTLVIGTYFRTFPACVSVVEIEPLAHEFGSELTPAVAAAVPRACDAIRELIAGGL
jgi:hydrogenase maturation protease